MFQDPIIENHKTHRIVSIHHCARCGGNHKNLRFNRLTLEAESFKWWAMCPDLNEPILMAPDNIE